MDKEAYNIALVIKTDGLEYDDRVRKEILTVQKLYPNISFKLFAMLPENKETEGITGYGVPFKTVYIPARDKYSSAKKPILKAYQFYKTLKSELKKYDAIWISNVDASFFPMLLKHKRILWDLHELPDAFLTAGWRKQILRYIFKRCRVVLHANPQRIAYLQEVGVIDDLSKHFAIRNYANFNDEERETDVQFDEFIKWKRGRKCFYLQGLTNDSRASYETIKALLNFPEYCSVVVGNFDRVSREKLEKEFGSVLNEKVLFIGKIVQLRIPHYVKQCFMSLVFYKNVRPNNYYCEANRFYQAVLLGLPVVVGNNPSMRELVDEYGFGISIDNDGSCVDIISEGIKRLASNYAKYKENTINNRDKLLWNSQEDIFKLVVEKLF